MAVDEKFESLVRFDLFQLDVKSGQLRRSGLPVDLPPQALRILVLLAARPDELVSRKETKEVLWPGESFGDFDSRVNFAVKRLREALGDDAERPRYVQTVRNAGYRFIAPVRAAQPLTPVLSGSVDRSNSGVDASPGSAAGTLAARQGFRRAVNPVFLVLLTVVLVAVAVAAVFRLRQPGRGQVVFSQTGVRPMPTEPGDEPHVFSMAPVFPQARQRIVIKGTGFGLHVPYAHTDSPYLSIRDQSAHWAAGRLIPQNWDEVMVDVESWMDTQIVVSGFSGDYGKSGWKLSVGDDLEVAVWNPQSGVGPAFYHVKVVAAGAGR